MGKIEDMRRLREQQVADGHRRQISPRPAEVVAPTVAPAVVPVLAPVVAPAVVAADAEPVQPSRPTRPAKGSAKKAGSSSADEQGKCSGCGKMKPVSNGLVANHQKGLGKACAGSRQKPA